MNRDHEQSKKLGPATSFTARMTISDDLPWNRIASILPASYGLLHDHDGGIHKLADRNGNSGERHDVRSYAHHSKRNEGNEHRTGKVITGMIALGTCRETAAQ